MNGGRAVSSITDNPNGRHNTTAVRNPARPVVRIRIGRPVRLKASSRIRRLEVPGGPTTRGQFRREVSG